MDKYNVNLNLNLFTILKLLYIYQIGIYLPRILFNLNLLFFTIIFIIYSSETIISCDFIYVF